MIDKWHQISNHVYEQLINQSSRRLDEVIEQLNIQTRKIEMVLSATIATFVYFSEKNNNAFTPADFILAVSIVIGISIWLKYKGTYAGTNYKLLHLDSCLDYEMEMKDAAILFNLLRQIEGAEQINCAVIEKRMFWLLLQCFIFCVGLLYHLFL